MAIEGKAGDFFKRIWDAIKTACRRILDAIAYIIKWVGNAIASADIRGQSKDYNFYKSQKARINKYASAAKVDDVKFNAPAWKVGADGLAKIIKTAESHYAKTTGTKHPDMKVMDNVSRLNLGTLHDASDFKKAYSKVFGIDIGFNKDQSAYKKLVQTIAKMKADIDEDLNSNIKDIFPGAKSRNTRALVMGALTSNSGNANVEMTVGKMKKLSKEFAVLSDSWLADNVKGVIATVHQHQKEFTQYTKNIDKIAAAFAKQVGDADNGFKAINNLTASLANSRVRYNGFWSNLMLEFESAALRFRKSAHIALKHYIRAAQKGGVDEKKSKKALSPESVEALFDFN